MSPEQALGAHLDHRTDIFSLGIVLYQMLTGRKPFVDDTERSALEKIRTDMPPAPRSLCEVDKHLEQLVLRCMEKEPADRFGSTQELVVALEQYLAATVNQNYRARIIMFLKEHGVLSEDETQATLHPALIGQYFGRRPLFHVNRRSRTGLLIAGLGVLLLAGGGFTYLKLWPKGEEQVTERVRRCEPTVVETETGFLRVTASPWARVEVDGKVLATTPFDRPVPLKPGPHLVRLTNPYFETAEREVHIVANQVLDLSVPLTRAPRATEAKPDSGDRP
jgi:serine/threonine-protein kinase